VNSQLDMMQNLQGGRLSKPQNPLVKCH